MKLFATLKHLFHPQRSNNHRPKFLHPKPLLFLSLIALSFYQIVGLTATLHPVGGSILGYASNITATQVIEQTNSLRTQSGLSSLSHNAQLSQAATAKAQNMFSEGYWAHTSPSGKEPWTFIRAAGYSYRIAGENLARDFDSTSPMMNAWMNSPTHKANIVNPRYEEIGIAVVDGLLNGVETTLVVQMFGAPSQQKVAAQPAGQVPTQQQGTVVPAVVTTAAGLNQQQAQASPGLEVQPNTEVETEPNQEATVLAETVVPQGQLSQGILYSPQHLLKAFFLSIIVILIFVLTYDALVAGHKDSVRFVGKNLAHILLFITIMYVIIAFKGGVVGP